MWQAKVQQPTMQLIIYILLWKRSFLLKVCSPNFFNINMLLLTCTLNLFVIVIIGVPKTDGVPQMIPNVVMPIGPHISAPQPRLATTSGPTNAGAGNPHVMTSSMMCFFPFFSNLFYWFVSQYFYNWYQVSYLIIVDVSNEYCFWYIKFVSPLKLSTLWNGVRTRLYFSFL